MEQDHRPKPHYYVYFVIGLLAIVMAISLTPGSITAYLVNNEYNKDFAPSYNIIKNEASIEAEGKIIGKIAEIKITAKNDYIYKTFYLWIGNEWKRFDFDSTEEWIRGEAKKTVFIDANKISEGKVAAYTCSWNGKMRCGCRSMSDCGYWQIKEFWIQY